MQQREDPQRAIGRDQLEVGHASSEQRVVTLTMHPEVVGRGYRFGPFAEWVTGLRERGVRFAAHEDVAAELS